MLDMLRGGALIVRVFWIQMLVLKTCDGHDVVGTYYGQSLLYPNTSDEDTSVGHGSGVLLWSGSF